MSYCPSQDWDRYIDSQDEAAEAEVAWWGLHKDRVLSVTCALLSNPSMLAVTEPDRVPTKEIVDLAAKIVMEITNRAEPIG